MAHSFSGNSIIPYIAGDSNGDTKSLAILDAYGLITTKDENFAVLLWFQKGNMDNIVMI